MGHLSHILHQDNALNKALRSAIQLDQPTCSALVDTGIPHYHANDIIKRLNEAQEIINGAWVQEARILYIAQLDSHQQDRAPAHSTAQVSSTHEHQQHVHALATMLPREKVRLVGVAQLADNELLALLLRTGSANEHVLTMAQRLLDDHDGLIGLAHMDIEELLRAHGLGPAKATEITAVFEIARRIARSKRAQRPTLQTPQSVFDAIGSEMAPLRTEELWCLALDTHARLIGEPRVISRGDVDGTEAGPRIIFRRALQLGAVQLIIAHNHPSGDSTPSDSDYTITQRLVQAGRILDIPLIDHIVIGDGNSYTSIRAVRPSLFGDTKI